MQTYSNMKLKMSLSIQRPTLDWVRTQLSLWKTMRRVRQNNWFCDECGKSILECLFLFQVRRKAHFGQTYSIRTHNPMYDESIGTRHHRCDFSYTSTTKVTWSSYSYTNQTLCFWVTCIYRQFLNLNLSQDVVDKTTIIQLDQSTACSIYKE